MVQDHFDVTLNWRSCSDFAAITTTNNQIHPNPPSPTPAPLTLDGTVLVPIQMRSDHDDVNVVRQPVSARQQQQQQQQQQLEQNREAVRILAFRDDRLMALV